MEHNLEQIRREIEEEKQKIYMDRYGDLPVLEEDEDLLDFT